MSATSSPAANPAQQPSAPNTVGGQIARRIRQGIGLRATTAGELAAAIERAKAHAGLALIECALDRDDCTAELLEWGSRVAAANSPR